jgi:hypothetical protein
MVNTAYTVAQFNSSIYPKGTDIELAAKEVIKPFLTTPQRLL